MFLVVQSLERKQGVTESFNQYLIIGKDLFDKVSTTRGNFDIGEDYQNLDELSNDHESYIQQLKDNRLIYAGTKDNNKFKTFPFKVDNIDYFCGIPKNEDVSEYTIRNLARCLIILFK